MLLGGMKRRSERIPSKSVGSNVSPSHYSISAFEAFLVFPVSSASSSGSMIPS